PSDRRLPGVVVVQQAGPRGGTLQAEQPAQRRPDAFASASNRPPVRQASPTPVTAAGRTAARPRRPPVRATGSARVTGSTRPAGHRRTVDRAARPAILNQSVYK